MKTFINILQHELNDSKQLFIIEKTLDINTKSEFWEFLHKHEFADTNSSDRNFIKYYLYYNILTCSVDSIKSKYNCLKQILENVFLKKELHELAFTIFSKIQKRYLVLSKFAYICKYKIAKLQISTDLYLNPICLTDKNVITIMHNKNKYLFIISDLVNIINAALGNSPYFFSKPLFVKNPYNNTPFTKANLYNIYFFMNKQNFLLPILFRQYFIANFNLKTFRNNNEPIIRDYAIDKYIETTHDKILSKDIKTMFKTNEYGKDIVIDEDFPYDKLVRIMKPYLNLYLYSVYSLNDEKRITSSIKLNKKLKKFVNFNIKFGRKVIMRSGQIEKVNYTYKFIDKHIEYINDDYTSFDKSHVYDFSNDSDNESDDTNYSDDESSIHTFTFTNNNLENNIDSSVDSSINNVNNNSDDDEEESNSSQTEYTFTEPSESYDAEYSGYVNEIVNFMSGYQ
jgi:hypothetical protein